MVFGGRAPHCNVSALQFEHQSNQRSSVKESADKMSFTKPRNALVTVCHPCPQSSHSPFSNILSHLLTEIFPPHPPFPNRAFQGWPKHFLIIFNTAIQRDETAKGKPHLPQARGRCYALLVQWKSLLAFMGRSLRLRCKHPSESSLSWTWAKTLGKRKFNCLMNSCWILPLLPGQP